jgi:hypothetical protein
MNVAEVNAGSTIGIGTFGERIVREVAFPTVKTQGDEGFAAFIGFICKELSVPARIEKLIC